MKAAKKSHCPHRKLHRVQLFSSLFLFRPCVQFAVACVSAGCANSRACSCYGLNSEPTTDQRTRDSSAHQLNSLLSSFIFSLFPFCCCWFLSSLARSSFLMNFIHRRRHRRERARHTHDSGGGERWRSGHIAPHETSLLGGQRATHHVAHFSPLRRIWAERERIKMAEFPKKKKVAIKIPPVCGAARALSRTWGRLFGRCKANSRKLIWLRCSSMLGLRVSMGITRVSCKRRKKWAEEKCEKSLDDDDSTAQGRQVAHYYDVLSWRWLTLFFAVVLTRVIGVWPKSFVFKLVIILHSSVCDRDEI